MTREQRIEAFEKLGKWMKITASESNSFSDSFYHKNAWYTPENIKQQLLAFADTLHTDNLQQWLNPYPIFSTNKSVGLILAGNIPLVGFHDILSTLIMGFTAQIKVSSEDAGLTPLILKHLIEIAPAFEEKIKIVDRLKNYDLIIATGSNNSARYFSYYFGKQPHIIRKNRNAVAVISGDETKEQLSALGKDIFDFFGLGCRSISKLFIPKDYQISTFYESIAHWDKIKDHHKYNNNYDYNKSIYLINKDKHYDNGFLLLKSDTALASPLAVVHYEEYDSLSQVTNTINELKEQIQCVVSQQELDVDTPVFAFGKSQSPAIDDYADGVNTLDFLYNNR